MLAAEMIGDAPCRRGLVDLRTGETRGEGRDCATGGLRHRCGDRTRINSARQEGADGHVGQHVLLHGVKHPLARLLDPLGFAAAAEDA